MHVELKHNGVMVNNGLGGQKLISYHDFVTEISKLATQDQSSLARVLALPEGSYVISQNGREATIGMYFESRRAKIRYGDETFENVLLPNVVIMVALNNFGCDGEPAVLEGIHWFCTDFPLSIMPRVTFNNLNNLPSSLKGHVWCLPFPNMYSGNNCQMCTGSNSYVSRFTDNQFAGLTSYFYDLFLGSRFNNDLSPWMIDGTSNWSSWLKRLEAATEFPYDKLRSI